MSLDTSNDWHEEARPLRDETQTYGSTEPPTEVTRMWSKSRKKMIHGKSSNILEAEHVEEMQKSGKKKYHAPTPCELSLMQVALSFGYTAYLITAWFSAATLHKVLFPVCSDYWASSGIFGPYLSVGCVFSIWVYWTFPILCCHILLLYFYRDLLQTRIYYVMFEYRVQLDFMNIGFFQAASVRLILLCFLATLLMYPLTGNLTFRSCLQTFPYWIPLASFIGMLYTQWDLETRLVSVAKLVEKDIEWAGRHIQESFFLRDYIAEEAFRRVAQELDKQKPAPSLSTGEYIVKIAEMAERMHEEVGSSKEEKKAWRTELKNKASKTVFHAVSPWYWGNRFLYSPYLVDDAAKNFHFWYRIYFLFTIVMNLLLLFVGVSTVLTILHHQGFITYLPVNWVNWLAVDWKLQAGSTLGKFLSVSHASFMQFVHPLTPWAH